MSEWSHQLCLYAESDQMWRLDNYLKAGGYQAWWTSLYEILDELLVPPLDQEKIYGTNARRVYRLAAE